MSSIHVLKYEIKQIILTKKYFYINLITLCFSCYVLFCLIIGGTNGTSPFSKLSYSNFLSLISPILLIMLILISINIFSEKGNEVRKIIFSTPISETKYYMIKGATVLAAVLLIGVIQIIFSFVYYGYLFNFFSYYNFILPMILFLIPPVILITGISFLLGRLNSKLLYFFLPVVFVMGMLNFKQPVWVDLCSNNFLSLYPLQMNALGYTSGTLPYILPMSFIASRIIFGILGLVLFFLACRIKKE